MCPVKICKKVCRTLCAPSSVPVAFFLRVGFSSAVQGHWQEALKLVVPFFIITGAVAPFLVVKWPPYLIITCLDQKWDGSDSDWKLAPNIIDKNN
jgi:hypothetical protein